MKNQELLQIVKAHTSDEHNWEVVEGQGRATVRCTKCHVEVVKGTRLSTESGQNSQTQVEGKGRVEIATGSDVKRSARLCRKNGSNDGLVRCDCK